jgi:hypothetical protein
VKWLPKQQAAKKASAFTTFARQSTLKRLSQEARNQNSLYSEKSIKQPLQKRFTRFFRFLTAKAKHFETEMAKNKGLSKEDLEAQVFYCNDMPNWKVRAEAEMRKEERKRDKEKQVELRKVKIRVLQCWFEKEREEAARKEEESSKSRDNFAKMKMNFQ